MNTLQQKTLRAGSNLKTTCQIGIGVLHDAGLRLQKNDKFAVQRYIQFLVKLHQIVRAAVPLMELALAKCKETDDPVCKAVGAYLEPHISEEEGHDQWILEDLGRIGIRTPDPVNELPGIAVASLVGAQYYWIKHSHPCSVLGYMAIMEGFHITKKTVDNICAATQLPRNCFRTLEEHAELDITHALEFWNALDAIPFSPMQIGIMRQSAVHTMAYYSEVLRSLPE